MPDEKDSHETDNPNPVPQPWKSFEIYLRLATNYGLAIFLVLYYVIVIQPREAKRIEEFRIELQKVSSALQTAESETAALKSSVGRIQEDVFQQHSDVMNKLDQIQNRAVVVAGGAIGSEDLTPSQLSTVRQRVEAAFKNHLLNSLSHNSHSRESFADEVRYVLSEEFRKNSPFDLRDAMFTADPQLVNAFDEQCDKLADFLFKQYEEEFGFNGNGKPITNAVELRNRARDHVSKQSGQLLHLAWKIVGK